MDSSLQLSPALVSLIIGAVSIFLFWKQLSSCFILFVKACQKLKTTGSRTPTSDQLPQENVNNALVEEVNTKASSSGSVKFDYDVFLSFRGDDTRNTFVSHLYKELKRKGIHTFKDDRELKRGNPISPTLLEAIEKSRISIVVLSPNYASSSWCLDELVKIVECMKTKPHMILPIFYNLDPSDVDEQTGVVSKSFEKHQKKFGNDKIQAWRDALSTVANIAGWDSHKSFDGNEAALIECIAGDVSDRLILRSSITTHLVGIDSHVKNIDGMLGLDCDDVRMVGIWGPGGVGKTTIADFIYHRDYNKYEACGRLKNVKDKYKKDGVVALQKELISQTLSEKALDIWDEDAGSNLICRRLQHKKVLIVLDDIDELKQLEVLANNVKWFGQGSRIIITTRDKHLLIQHDVKHIYSVPVLKESQALQLFSLHAFRENQPLNGFLELSNNFVSYTQGLPLALKILGRSLYKREISFWQSELEKLKKIPDVDICRVLRISYDGLDDLVKDVFLDIAFFFDGKTITTTENVLDNCGFYPRRAFTILEDKALITITDDKLDMHDLIKMMGHEIVREEAKDPNKRSRVCHAKDVCDVLTSNKDATSVEGIYLDMSDLRKPINLKSDVFMRLDRLRILIFVRDRDRENHDIQLLEGLDSLPNELRYIHWECFPLDSLPSNSFGENLIELILPNSNIQYVWKGEEELHNLRVIDLSGSKGLNALRNLSKVPNVEEIKLEHTREFNEFSSDIRHLNKLKILNLKWCRKLDKLPTLPPNLVELDLSNSGIRELPSEVQSLTKLEVLKLGDDITIPQILIKEFIAKTLLRFPLPGFEERSIRFPTDLTYGGVKITNLPESIGELKRLSILHLGNTGITALPESIGHLHELKSLHLMECRKLVTLPNSMQELVSLRDIYIRNCESLGSLPELPSSLESLEVKCCVSLEMLQCNDWDRFKKLRSLKFVGCNKLEHRASNEIMEHVRVMIHSLQEDEVLEYFVPGSEIPSWFGYRSCETSITAKLPSLLHQVQGFAFCVVYETIKNSGSNIDWGNCISGDCAARCDLLDSLSKVEVEGYSSDTSVAVWYKRCNDPPRDVLTRYPGCEVRFDFFSFSDKEGLIISRGDMKLKGCGVYVISDEETFASSSSSSGIQFKQVGAEN